MQGMVLAAGVGSRLEPLTTHTPKPMVPLANRPAMEHILALLANHGISDVAANLWYLPDQIKSYFGDGSKLGVQLRYSEERELMGTAGGVKKLSGFFTETFVVIAGDALTDVNLTELISFHKRKKALATIAVKPVEDPTHYGVVVTEEDGKIRGFQEKPKPEEALSFTANTGIYVFEPEIMEFIPEGTVYDFGRELFPRLVKENAPFFAWSTEDYWCDVGTHAVYHQANLDIAQGKVNLFTPDFAQVTNGLIIGEGTMIAENACLGGANVIGVGCQINEQAYINDSVLWDRVTVGNRVCIEGATIGNEVKLLAGAVIPKACVIGDRAVIGPKAHLQEGEVIPAEAVVE